MKRCWRVKRLHAAKPPLLSNTIQWRRAGRRGPAGPRAAGGVQPRNGSPRGTPAAGGSSLAAVLAAVEECIAGHHGSIGSGTDLLAAGCCSRLRSTLSPRDDSSRSEGAVILFQACSKGKQRTVCATGAQDREPEWATIECSKGERKLWQAAEPGNAKQ